MVSSMCYIAAVAELGGPDEEIEGTDPGSAYPVIPFAASFEWLVSKLEVGV